MLTLLLTPEKTAVAGLNTEGQIALPRVSIEELPIAVGQVTKIENPTGQRLWEPEDITGWTIQAAIGEPFTPPQGGTWILNHGAFSTAPIAYPTTAIEVEQEATNAGILVGVEELSEGYYRLTWTVNGARALASVDPEGLFHSAVAEVKMLQEGTVDTKSVQTVRLLQAPAASGVLSTLSDEVTGTVEVLQVGASGINHRVRLSFAPAPYDGGFGIVIEGFEGPVIPFNASEEEMVTALEANSEVGAGNVSVIKEGDGRYLIGFQGERAGSNMGIITVDDSGLRAVPMFTGALDTNTEAIETMLGTDNEVTLWLEITGAPSGGAERKLYREPITLVAPILRPTV